MSERLARALMALDAFMLEHIRAMECAMLGCEDCRVRAEFQRETYERRN